MTTRTVQFIGKAFSSTGSLNVTFELNNVELFNGTVSASTDALPSKQLHSDAGVVFTVDLDTDVTGTVPLEILTQGGSLSFFNLKSNYSGIERAPDSSVIISPVDFYHDLCTRTTEHDGRFDVEINRIPRTRWDEEPPPAGQLLPSWGWLVPEDSIFTCNVLIGTPVVEIPPVVTEWNETTPYPIKSVILQGSDLYMALKTIPAGTQLTDTTYWEKASNRV
jgi:hypothetical protein